MERLIAPYRLSQGRGLRLAETDAIDTHRLGAEDQDDAKMWLSEGVRWLAQEQHLLDAQDRGSVLLVFQVTHAAGKDGTVKHVMSGVSPQGCQVCSFKKPSAEDLDHDFMWRCSQRLPECGRIGNFNHSYSEEILVVRIPQAILASQKLPAAAVGKKIWQQRLSDIASCEDCLARQGALIVASFRVLRPFLAATIWATMIVVTTWPMLRWIEARLRGRHACWPCSRARR